MLRVYIIVIIVTISAESIPLDFTPASRKASRSTQFRIKGSFRFSESMISEKGLRSLVAPRAPWGPIWTNDFKSEGAYLVAAVEITPKSPRIDRGGRAIAAADIGSTASYGRIAVLIQEIKRQQKRNMKTKTCFTNYQEIPQSYLLINFLNFQKRFLELTRSFCHSRTASRLAYFSRSWVITKKGANRQRKSS